MAKKSLPSPELLRKLLDYDPETGLLTWKPRPRELFPTDASFKGWNTRRAGTPALCYIDARGYRSGSIMGVGVRAHRVVLAMANGRWPEVSDHINGDKGDNRLSNLRDCSQSENCRNAKRPSDNKSGVVGVHRLKGSATWVASIAANGEAFHLGRFPSKEEATAARQKAEAEHNFHPNHGRL